MTVVETGSLTRAAQAMGCTQSAVSHSIDSLEQELGFALLKRSRAGVRTATIAAAVRYLHAPASLGCVRDFDGILTLTRLFLQAVADGAAAGR